MGTSSSAGGHLTQKEEAKEAIAIRMSQKFALLEEERPIIETMAYNDKYKKILNEVWKDKVELDGKIIKEEEEAVKRIKGEALKEKEDLEAFIFPIRLEGQLGREDMKKVDRGITMINHTQAEAMGILTNVFCQVGVTTLIAKFLILDIPIEHDSPIVVGRGFLRTIGAIVNTPERLFSAFDGFCHQTFRAARSNFMRNAESDSDDEEDYQIKRNKFRAPIYGPKPAPYLNCNDPDELSIDIQTEVIKHEDVLNRMGCNGEIDDMLRIRLREAGSDEEIFTSVAWIRAFNINEPIYVELCHGFYSTYEFDKVYADDELQSKKIIKFRLGGRAHSLTLLEFARRLGLYQAVELEEEGFNVYFEGGYDKIQKNDLWLLSMFDARHQNGVLTEDVVRSLSAPIYCRDLDTITLRDLIDSEGKLIPEDPQPGMPRVGIPRPPRTSMQDLYHGVFEHMAGVYSIPLQGAYNPPGYAQPQYDQYYQQYPPPPP
ncbi:hypothetical protein Tco_0508808 [Tanacetum coccineum]